MHASTDARRTGSSVTSPRSRRRGRSWARVIRRRARPRARRRRRPPAPMIRSRFAGRVALRASRSTAPTSWSTSAAPRPRVAASSTSGVTTARHVADRCRRATRAPPRAPTTTRRRAAGPRTTPRSAGDRARSAGRLCPNEGLRVAEEQPSARRSASAEPEARSVSSAAARTFGEGSRVTAGTCRRASSG